MASHRRRTTNEYKTYGSVAYAPSYGGAGVRVPQGHEAPQTVPHPKQREQVRKRTLVRTRVQVRPAGHIAPFAVVGFLAVAIFAVMLVMSYAQLAVANDQAVALRRQLQTLESENAILTAQYERVFDMEKLQAAVGGNMIRPTDDQIVYIDLSEPDNVTVYGEQGTSGVVGALESAGEILGRIVEYFR